MADLPVRPDLEFDKKQAKALLAAVRAGDADARRRMLAHAPRLGAAGAAPPTLADAQFVVARERGFESWPKLKAAIEAAQSPEALVRQFLQAIGDAKTAVARRLAVAHPAMARSSIHAAAALGESDLVRGFLERDPALLTAADERGWPPLMYACWSRFHASGPSAAERSLRTIRLLLDHGADANTFALFNPDDQESRLPALYCACESNHVSGVRLLLERGANPNDGESTYHSAQHGRLDCLELLVAHGADLSSRHPRWNNTPLYFLAGHQDDEAGTAAWLKGVLWLLDHGADPNITSYDQRETPLHALVRSGRTIAAARALLDHGSNVDALRADGRTPYAIAVRNGNDAGIELLRSRGARTGGLRPVDALLGACMRGDDAAAGAILAGDPGLVAGLTDEDRGLAAAAAAAGRADALRVMAALGFDLAWEGPDGGTALHHAAWWGRPDAVRALVALGAPVNVRDRTFGSSPIAWAAHGSTNCRKADEAYCEIVDLLLAAGSEYAAAVNTWGEPPEGMASRLVAARLEARGFTAPATA